MEVYRPVIGGSPASSAYAMPCGTSSVLSTIPATTSLASHSRRKGISPRASLNIGPTSRQLPWSVSTECARQAEPSSSPLMGEEDQSSPRWRRHDAHVDHVESAAPLVSS